MRYFVTGGAGFIGANYVAYLLENELDLTSVTIYDKFTYAGNKKNYQEFSADPRLTVLQGDICESAALQSAMEGHNFVVHFAAESHVDRSISNASEFIQTNVLGTHNVLVACRELGVQTMIHVSTDEVYGSLVTGSASEEHLLQPNSPYASSKASSDLIARSFFITHGLDVRITRCCNNYGRFQFPEKVIPVFIRALSGGDTVPIYGNGSNVREWIHVIDHCKAIHTVLKKGKAGEIYNIGTGYHLTNYDLANAIMREMNISENRIAYVPDRKGHDFRYSVNSEKIGAIGFVPTMDFKTGLAFAINWYLENPDWFSHHA
jgi:dTDP-glucose 4,6-dehydratase